MREDQAAVASVIFDSITLDRFIQSGVITTANLKPPILSKCGNGLEKVAAVAFVGSLFVFLVFMAGITPEGLLYDHWPDTNEHPTNWYDTALHPFAK